MKSMYLTVYLSAECKILRLVTKDYDRTDCLARSKAKISFLKQVAVFITSGLASVSAPRQRVVQRCSRPSMNHKRGFSVWSDPVGS